MRTKVIWPVLLAAIVSSSVALGAEAMESTVNLLHVPVWHQKFGYSLDELNPVESKLPHFAR